MGRFYGLKGRIMAFERILRMACAAGLLFVGATAAHAAAVDVAATADSHGNISPTGTVTVAAGSSTSFVVTADSYYHVSSVLTNGGAVAIPPETNMLTVNWSNLFQDSHIHARFAPNLATNGVPEWWLATHGWTSDFDAAATNDQDDDLVPTWLEYWETTDPKNSNAYLGFDGLASAGEETLTLSWLNGSNVFYTVACSTDLVSGSFATITQNVSAHYGDPSVLVDVDVHPNNAAYRVQVQTEGPIQYVGWAVGARTHGYGYIIHTRDGGYTWERQGYPGEIADVSLEGVIAVDPQTAWVVGGADSGYSAVYRTTNGGAAWVRFGSPGVLPTQDLQKVSAFGSNIVWAVGGNGTVVVTTNAGVDWTHYTVPGYSNTWLQGVFAVDSECVWVSGETNDGCATILRTTNAGASWVRQKTGAITNVNHILGVSAVSRDCAAAAGGLGYWILITTNGGDTWEGEQHGADKDGNEVCMVSSSEVWAACDSAVFWTTNGGVDWVPHTTADYTMDVDVVGTQGVWAVRQGLAGTIFHTPDHGDHWAIQSIPNTELPGLENVSFAK